MPVSNKTVYYYATASVTTPAIYVQCDANWQNTATAVRCQKVGAINTGYQEQEQQDISPCSSTYNQLRWVNIGANATACPISTCSSATCTGNSQKCINGVCTQGVLTIISQSVNHGTCFMNWGYAFPDGTKVFDHTTSKQGACDLN